ncbi:MAG: hypothetical protein GX288_04225 [Clostridiales bacterium]|nr:hypothetical protein [Clostridiales bacterium]
MMQRLNKIRIPIKDISLTKQIVNTILVFLFGIVIGLFAKILDCTPSNELPYFLDLLDLGSFFSRMAIWLLIAVALSIYSHSPIRAGINVFLFFTGMLISYYTYTKYMAGFFPKSYIRIWVMLTFLSPFLAFICWYAKGNTKISLILSSIIVGILFDNAFNFGYLYFNISYMLEVIVWLLGIFILYNNPKQLLQMLALSIIVAIIWSTIYPYSF